MRAEDYIYHNEEATLLHYRYKEKRLMIGIMDIK